MESLCNGDASRVESIISEPKNRVLISKVLKGLPGIIWNLSPYSEGRERPKNEASHSRLVGGMLNKQREEACLGWLQDR